MKAVSFSLPTWKSNIGYEEGESWVLDSMVAGYPRFYIHKSISALAEAIVETFTQPGQNLQTMLFPSRAAAQRCESFMKDKAPTSFQEHLNILHLVLDSSNSVTAPLKPIRPTISAVFFVPEAFGYAKQYWQHSGDGVTSRRAEFCHRIFKQGLLVSESHMDSTSLVYQIQCKGPRRYQRHISVDETVSTMPSLRHGHANRSASDSMQITEETSRFVEERFGRNLDVSLVERAKTALRRRIAGILTSSQDNSGDQLPRAKLSKGEGHGLTEHDIYLYPMGMNAIFHAHRLLLSARGALKSISFGFPYVDTLKILQKFGPGCVFYGHASEADLDDLERRLKTGERFLGLFCEFPGNPVLSCPNLQRIRNLADDYGFAVVVDDTIGTFANINVLQYADIIASSLTKIFSGDCNVMGGSLVLNPESRYYGDLKVVVDREYEDTFWAEDAIFLERNSRDFLSRTERVNSNAEAICELLAKNPLVKTVHYPKYSYYDRANYDAVKLPNGGYGGLLSVVFYQKAVAITFFDNIATAKGPSLGTNFTLTSPYVLLAHYAELDWAASLGVDPDLIRISIGLEEKEELVEVFRSTLLIAEKASQVQT